MSAESKLTDMHTACVNRLVGAYVPKACKGLSLHDKGYDWYIDPKYETESSSIEADFLSVGRKDVQHFKTVGATSNAGRIDNIVSNISEIESDLEDILDLKDISSDMVNNFLKKKGTSVSPDVQEVVALLPSTAYEEYKSKVDNFCEENDIQAWKVELNGRNKVKKIAGKHNLPEVDELISGRGTQDGIQLCDIDSSLSPVVRNSDMSLIKFRFACRLITYAHGEQTTLIPYEDIDDIMLNAERPILGHLSEDERDKYWQQCMLTLRNTLNEIKQSQEGVNVFEWEKQRFLYDNSARSSLIEEIRSGLDLGEEA